MPVTVSAPNGATIDFPDGTDHDTINRVMTQNFHPDDSVRAAAAPKIPTYEIAGPDGGTYHIDAPDEHAAIAAWQAFQGQNTGGSANAPAAAPATLKRTFTIQAPTGKSYTVDGDNAEGALAALKKHIGGGSIGDDRAATVAGLRGIPLLGAYVDKGTAMLNAAAQPFMESGLSHADNYSDRVAENEKTIKSATDKYENDHPIETGIGKTFVGAGALAPLGATALGARAMGMAGEALLPSMLKGAGSFGALNAGDAALRGDSVGNGLVAGALGGAAGPIAGRAIEAGINGVRAAAAPIFANVKARVNPEGYAQSQVARAVSESGQTPAALGQAVADANAEGQPFTLADALGNSGQRMLSTVTRAPGEGRTAAVNFLDARQAGQGRRVSNALSEGFNAPETAAQTEGRLTTARDAQADTDYGAVRGDAAPVDVSNVVDHIDGLVSPFGVPHDRIAPDGITGRMLAYRRMLSGGDTNLDGSAARGLNDFSAAQRVRQELSDEIQQARQSGAGNKARLLGGVLRQLDTSLENSSNGFRQANANFSQASRDIDAVGQGRDAFNRGRTEDTIPAFNALRPQAQQAFRAGYVDPAIAQTQGAAGGANKARPLLNDAFQQEAATIAPGNPLMQRRLAREQTMFETRAQATGGSRTADNLADAESMGVDPHLVHSVITGNWHGAIGSALRAGHNALTGNTPAVRAAVGRMLLDRGVNPTNLQAAIGQTVQRIQFVQSMARGVGRGVGNGLVIAGPSHRQSEPYRGPNLGPLQ